jgi:voltage-gated potassium channel
VMRVRDAFQAEAHSTSALGAPALALAALDPRIIHSFQVGGHLMVVSRFHAAEALSRISVNEVRDQFGGLTLAMVRGGAPEILHPPGSTRIQPQDVLTVQAEYADYLKLRVFTNESQPPMYARRS